jgi:phenylglyoxylate dehydrogenase epsilon subunit
LKKRKHLIIGCGTAALSALKQIRKVSSEDEVKLVTMGSHPPYSPMSLPYVISERVSRSDIQMVPDDFFGQMNATLLKNRRVVRVDPPSQRVTYDNGESDTYDRLLIATGSDAIVPSPLKEAGCSGFHVMDDCLNLKERLKEKKRVSILGAGLVAMELAVALREKGSEVTVIAPRERILRRYFDTDAGRMIIDAFMEKGVAVNLNWGEPTAAQKSKGEIRVRFGQERKIETQILLACIGVTPRVSFLTDSGIAMNEGILVDRQMRASLPNIFAAGDVAEAADFFTGRKGLNPILPNAVLQGKVAGRNMADQGTDYEGWLPMNTFNFFGHLAVSVGKAMPSENDEVFMEKDGRRGSYKKIICKEGRLLGAAFLDTGVDAGVFQYLIKRKVNLGKVKEMLVEAPREVSLWLMHETEKRESISLEE